MKEENKKCSKLQNDVSELISKENDRNIDKALICIVCVIAIIYGMYGVISNEIKIKNSYTKAVDLTTNIYPLYYVDKLVCENDKIYLMDKKNHAVQIFNLDGQHLFTVSTANLKPVDIGVKDQGLYIVLESKKNFGMDDVYYEYYIDVDKIEILKSKELKKYEVKKDDKNQKNKYISKSGKTYKLRNNIVYVGNTKIKLRDIPRWPLSNKFYSCLIVFGFVILVFIKFKIVDIFNRKISCKEKIL